MYKHYNENNISKVFGKLTIVGFSHKDFKQRALYWKCLCYCGNEVVVRFSSLTQGNTRSCGCYQKQLATKIIVNANHKRILPIGLAAKRDLYRRYKKNGSNRGLNFELTFDELCNITSKICEYCGIKPNQYIVNDRWNGSYVYNGIDRVDNNKGYTTKNVVPCCKVCNLAKGTRTKDEFISWIRLLYKNFINK